MVNRAIKLHSLSATCAAALGRTMTVATFMASGLKSEGDRLSITVAGDGPIGKITVCGNGKLQMRGYVDNPKADLIARADGKLDVGGIVGNKGRITVVRSMGLKEPYSGTAEIVSGEIAEDFATYYALSEQQPTAIALGVKIDKDLTCIGAGGVIVQAMPGATEKDLIWGDNAVKQLNNLSTLIENMGAEGVLERFFDKHSAVSSFCPVYKCLCSRKNTERTLKTLGKKELTDLIEKDGKITVTCEFCGAEYIFNKDDIEGMF